MASPSHTYGPTCALRRPTQDPLETSDPPEVHAQFFYEKKVPIDDPLSPLPPLPPDSKLASTKHPPQPFSAKDNAALEEAWSAYRREISSKLRRSLSQDPDLKTRPPKSAEETGNGSSSTGVHLEPGGFENTKVPSLVRKGSRGTRREPPNGMLLESVNEEDEPSRGRKPLTHKDVPDSHVMLADEPSHDEGSDRPLDETELRQGGRLPRQEKTAKRHRSPFHFRHRSKEKGRLSSEPQDRSVALEGSPKDDVPLSSSGENSRMSGRPFARAPSNRKLETVNVDGTNDEDHLGSLAHPFARSTGRTEVGECRSVDRSSSRSSSRSRHSDFQEPSRAFVPVGISRLHLVEMPDLVMKPIYWNPINDISSVNRATWFYKETMMPLDIDLANQVEIGYEYMRPWTQTWQEELDSCIEIGAAAELKVVHRIWPKENEKKSSTPPGAGNEMKSSSLDGIDTEDSLPQRPQYDMNLAIGSTRDTKEQSQPFKNHSVVFVNAKDAQILRPSLLPSPSRGRAPLNAIRKGRQIGIAIVRGFDNRVWNKLHPPDKMSARLAQARVGAYLSQSGDAATLERRSSCTACRMEEDRPGPTDLILVIHGIGQKLSQRVDSFHFTHAINSFRREVNIELSSEAVQGHLRPEMGGIMVLPINWRLTLSFDETDVDNAPADPANNRFSLKDITPETLPAVRNVISDVMLDIPYYLSNHKQKMITAVIKEANRVYRLWCRNNPGFEKTGRVHLIAHSLGAAMTIDILSQQPTKLSPSIHPRSRKVSEDVFEFDTKSLFCCGSPVGFFLLLNRASLLPRKRRDKPESDREDLGKNIAGEVGTYGCLAVDNIYNVMHYNDPIAYHVNAAVDADYAASLKEARIPSASPGLFANLPNPFKWNTGLNSNDTNPDAFGSTARPNMTKLPSTIEMDTHDFSREEIAEKRMFLLNDNGQIDYFLSSGGGPLEIQYLSMLSAHSSYWTLKDFIRFLVLEVGRKRGKSGTLPALRAEKKRIIKAGKIA